MDNEELKELGWTHIEGKFCLLCGAEKLYYKYYGVGMSHCLYCEECKATQYGRTEAETKRQCKNGGT